MRLAAGLLNWWRWHNQGNVAQAGWAIGTFPECRYHVFLSHCQEDRERLVFPLRDSLQRIQRIPWMDCHDYPKGRPPFAALRDSLLECRHVVFLITESMLDQPRGWTMIESA